MALRLQSYGGDRQKTEDFVIAPDNRVEYLDMYLVGNSDD